MSADDPIATSQRLMKRPLPRRFYARATSGPHGDGWAVLLDGKVARTPARGALVVDRAAIAEAMAAEWDVQGELIDPGAMPVTRLVNAAIDRVAGDMDAVRSEIAKYAGSDLICYRAEEPESLVAVQVEAWDALVAWARADLGAPLVVTAGINHVEQPAEVREAVARALAPLDALVLAAASTVTTLTGSAIVALALLRGRLTPDEAWTAAHVDEDWQMARWGRDEVALARRAARRRDFGAAAMVIADARSM